MDYLAWIVVAIVFVILLVGILLLPSGPSSGGTTPDTIQGVPPGTVIGTVSTSSPSTGTAPPGYKAVAIQCPTGMVMAGNGNCTTGCGSGYDLNSGKCYQQCPSGWQGTSTSTACNKDRKYSPGKAITLSCPSGTTYFKGLCYQVPSGYSMSSAGRAVGSCNSGYTMNAGNTLCEMQLSSIAKDVLSNYRTSVLPTRSGNTTTDCAKYSKYQGNQPCPSGWVKTAVCTCEQLSCPAGYSYDSGSCYKNCPSGYSASGLDCVKSGCPSGYQESDLYCTRPYSSYSPPTKFITGTSTVPSCPSGYSMNSLKTYCYASCPSGYSRNTDDLEYCDASCPSGWKDTGLGCTKPVVTPQLSPLSSVGECPAGAIKQSGSCWQEGFAGKVSEGFGSSDGLYSSFDDFNCT